MITARNVVSTCASTCIEANLPKIVTHAHDKHERNAYTNHITAKYSFYDHCYGICFLNTLASDKRFGENLCFKPNIKRNALIRDNRSDNLAFCFRFMVIPIF